MIEDNIKRPYGEVEIQLGEEKLPIINTVVDNARELIARALGGSTPYLIDIIEVYNLNTKLAEASVEASYPEFGLVKFTAIFAEESFFGSFDEVRLKNSIHGNFSIVTNFSLTKPNDQILSIGWKIKPQ